MMGDLHRHRTPNALDRHPTPPDLRRPSARHAVGPAIHRTAKTAGAFDGDARQDERDSDREAGVPPAGPTARGSDSPARAHPTSADRPE